MSIGDKWSKAVYRVVTGGKSFRTIITPIAAIIFFSIITLFVLASFWVDNWLGLPRPPETWWRYGMAIILFIVGVPIAGWVAIRFFLTGGTPVPTNPPPKLITTELYAYVRNPMAIGLLLIPEGMGFWFGSLSLIIFFAPLPVLLYALYIRTVEEPELEMRFGQEYLEYKKRVPMFIPKLKKQG